MRIDLPTSRTSARAWLVGLLLAAGVLAIAGRAGATVITAFPVDFAVAEQTPYGGAVATFEDDNPAAAPADFTAVIDWGDGSPTSPGTITESAGTFTVAGQHTYADEGTFTVTVTISDVAPGTGTATATDTATVSELDALSGAPRTFSVPAGVSFTTTVATFTDMLTDTPPSDFTATIDWGDATTSAGGVSGGGGSFSVSGTHTYASTGSFPVMVTLSDDAPGTATATVTSSAIVANGFALTATSFSTPEGAVYNGQVGTFSDSDTSKTAADFTASIAWGDGTTSAGTVTGGSGTFTVSGQHTYADEGSFATSVTVTEIVAPNSTGTSTATATVTENDALFGSPVTFQAQATIPFSGVVASFTDGNSANVASDFTATIDWGDGSPPSAGTVSGGAGAFTVSGSHTYATPGSFTVTVTLRDDAPGTAFATSGNTAQVAPPPLVTVPTLDLAGLLALALALGGLGMALLARRR